MCQTFQAMLRLVNEFPKFFYTFIYGFQSLTEELGFWIQIVSGIPDSLICISDSKDPWFRVPQAKFSQISNSTNKNFSDSGIRIPSKGSHLYIFELWFREESVTSRSHGSKSSGWQQQGAYDNGKGNKNGKKELVYKAKQQLCTRNVYTFFNHHCTTATWNFLISRARFMVREHNTKMHGLFLNLDAVLSDSTLENFAKIWQIKWNWIRLTRFETVRIHILSEVFGLLSSWNFATVATWLSGFSSLLPILLISYRV